MFSRFKSPNTALRDRSALLGVTPPASGRSSPYNSSLNSEPSGHRYVDDLEGQNDEALEGLAAKVKLLKDVSSSSKKTLCAFPVSLTHFLVWLRYALRKDYYWHWKRGSGLDGTTEPDGACQYVCWGGSACLPFAMLRRMTHSRRPRASSLARFVE
jgi:hypothetical protein